MAQLAIKGHETRGTEVIALLEMLGGINVDNLYGDDTYDYYTITYDKEIDAVFFKYSDDKARIFTLEEFEKKFPYKVGDKVYNIIHNENQTITDLAWDSKENEVVYQTNNNEYVFVNYLQPYKKETVEEEGVYADNEINCYHQDFGDKVRIRLGGDFEIKVEDNKTYIVKKKPHYPKTYKECCEVLMGKTDFQDFELVLTKLSINQAQSGINIFSPAPPHITLINNFYKLLICRDAYWRITGEQMGLGKPWKPDYTNDDVKFCICCCANLVVDGITYETNQVLTFPTIEIRAIFLENFKELIEQCKELL